MRVGLSRVYSVRSNDLNPSVNLVVCGASAGIGEEF